MSKLIVIDVEATCQKNFSKEFKTKQEIIEFGIHVVEENSLSIIHKLSIIVKPIFHPQLTDFCKELTGITQKQVDNGVPFTQAIEIIKQVIREPHKVLPSQDIFCSWGNFDYNIIDKNCNLHKVFNPFKSLPSGIGLIGNCGMYRHVNLKQFIADWYRRKPCGLKRCCSYLKIGFQGQHHSAIDDSFNIVRILRTIQDKDKISVKELLETYEEQGSGGLHQVKFNLENFS